MKNFFETNDYFNYLLKNFSIDNENSNVDCTRPDIEIINHYLEQMDIDAQSQVFEVGSGLGRILLFLNQKYSCEVNGLEISKKAALYSKEKLNNIVTDIINLPVEELDIDKTFSHIICWGVFDLTRQHRALTNMLNHLKVGGKLLLTGKNDNFHEDDEEALIAETKTREKGVKNHFTDFSLMKKAIETCGCKINVSDYYERRDEFALLKKINNKIPEKFYEYAIIIEKVENVPIHIPIIESLYSKTWRNINEKR